MVLTEEEKVALLELTVEQEKAFNKLQKAFKECDKVGIKFVGVEEFHYAFNGKNLESSRDYDNDLSEDEVDMDWVESAPSFVLSDPYINVSVALKVRT